MTENIAVTLRIVIGIIQMLDRLRNWATEQLTSKELHNIERQTAWHLEVAKGKLEALGKLWDCANEELRPQESSKFC